MLQRSRIAIVLISLLVTLSSLAAAQTFGRIVFIITDPDGNPLQDVKITASSEQLTRFKAEKTTNKRGRAVVSVVDALKFYTFVIEHPDYPGVKRSLKPLVGTETTIEISLTREQTDPETGTAGKPVAEPTFTPAEKAFNGGVDALRSDDVAAAHASFDEALALDPDLTQAHSALARVHLRLKNHEEAISHAEVALAASPGDSALQRVLYDAHGALGNNDEAEAARKAMEGSLTSGELATMMYNEGVAALRVGDDDSAETRFKEALVKDPALAPANRALAILYARKGQWQHAGSAAERYLAAQPDDKVAMRIRWDAAINLGDAEAEKKAFDALVAAGSTGLAAEFLETGQRRFNANDTEGAAQAFERTLRLDPSNVRVHYDLSLCYVNMGRTDDAKTHLEKFIELAPDDPDIAAAKEMLSYL